jgi:predicted pyridoxine 5'-phosphate oxidase superfamily flavin-nucleotide-binding protein
MDPAVILLLVFMVYSALLGVCLARMRAINRELDTMKQLFVTVGTVQRDGAQSFTGNTSMTTQDYESVLAVLKNVVDSGGNG